MSTQSTPPLPAMVTQDFNWLTHHLILVGTIALLVFGAVYGVDTIIVQHDVAKNAEVQQILATQAVQTKAIEEQRASDEAAWQARDAQETALITQLAGVISERNFQLEKQKRVDATLTATDAAQRLIQQTNAQPSEITVQGENVLIDLPITRQVIARMDQLPVLQADLSDTQKQLGSETVVATNLQNDLDINKNLVLSLKTQLTDSDKACKAQIAVVKAKARRGKMKAFAAGFVSGLTLGIWKF